ncbi:MAG: ACT domain-containing protein [Clostridia bacterium]|nr:ACT domain-containing protein [Clostridia bacterium]
MNDNKNLIIVDTRVLPSVFSGVLQAKKMLTLGKAKTVGEAAQASGISRSAYYKYKDFVFPVNDMKGIWTISFELADIAGILSQVLQVMAKAKCNILTINQNIPVNGVANITISMRNNESSFQCLMKKLEKIQGIRNIHIMAKE